MVDAADVYVDVTAKGVKGGLLYVEPVLKVGARGDEIVHVRFNWDLGGTCNRKGEQASEP